jgi:hypothetical protein
VVLKPTLGLGPLFEVSRSHTHTHTHSLTHTLTHKHTHKHTHSHTYTHSHTHTHSLTHSSAPLDERLPRRRENYIHKHNRITSVLFL